MAAKGDMKMHSDTYHGFLSLIRWGTGVTIVVAALVIIVIAN